MKKLLLIISMSFAGSAHSASFDCAKAKTDSERQICSVPELSSLDEKMSDAFKDAKAKLSKEAQKTFVNGQRASLKYQSKYCFIDSDGKKSTKQNSVLCQIEEYKSRIETLKKTGNLIYGLKTFPYFEGKVGISREDETSRTFSEKRQGVFIEGSSEIARELNSYVKNQTRIDNDDWGVGSVENSIELEQLNEDVIKITERNENTHISVNIEVTFCYFSKKLTRFIKNRDVFNSPKWIGLAENIARKRFLKEKIDADGRLFRIYDTQDDNFRYDLVNNGFDVSNLTHPIEWPDAPVNWESFEKYLTPFGKEFSKLSKKR